MGAIKIRSKDVKLAKDCRHLRLDYDSFKSVEQLREYIDHLVIDGFGMRIEKKTSRANVMSKFTTTYYKEMRLGIDFDELDEPIQAVVMAHELVHVYQWRHYGRAKFGPKYVMSGRFRWAMEMQAYRESVRWRKLMNDSKLDQYCKDRWEVLWREYFLWPTLRRDHVRNKTRKILREEAESFSI